MAWPGIDPRDSAVLSLLGHDLRAALSEVIGGLRLVDTSALPAAQSAQIARCRASGEALALLLEQALGVLTVDPEPGAQPEQVLQTSRLIDSLRLRWADRMATKGLSFSILSQPEMPQHLGIDAALLERIFSNLLGNAIKYARAGEVSCALATPAGKLLEITVSDQGPGFAKGAEWTIFSGGGGRLDRSKPGSGMGLKIVHDMVARAGGTIVARNRPEGGAQIVVRLPLHSVDLSSIEVLPSLVTPDLSALRVLVADDNVTSRTLHSSLLGSMGAEVVSVADGVQAIGRIERESFDLALIDIEMPQMNGLDVIRHIRAMGGKEAEMPILAVTAYRLRANRTAIELAGADGIVSKPVGSATALRDQIMTVLERRREQAASPTDFAEQQVVPLQFARLLKMAGPDSSAEIVAGIQSDLRSIERGLLAALHEQSWNKVGRLSHNLVAIAGTVGAGKLQDLAAQMNDLANDPNPDRSTFLTMLPQLLESLDGLIQFVTDYSNSIRSSE